MIKQAFAKNYIPSGGNYKYYKINDPRILDSLLDCMGLPVIDVINAGKLLSFVKAQNYSRNYTYALRTDNSYQYSADISAIIGIPGTHISVTGDITKIMKLFAELMPTPPSKEDWDEQLSMFQEISKEEYESMITK